MLYIMHNADVCGVWSVECGGFGKCCRDYYFEKK